ncbi:Rieske 2Fe-2S domain-containing protein [Campylobacter canadensis]|uniref:Rieske 2Fe-2S domain-containing protein n=2 Tax=Campylobacter canadensis TaxID=449520 RepID=A0ABS7WR27_9BACT|nr:Rieske 2Fe-2S domain-containing protein [Campylobacter canadensis]MBZ7994304.1 Rieske 2Fe-2S domain-containing protein [Campylobacter canadensis]MBZ7996000.1 Rieske 2Fe-2S domain-containing protein [Campylobacter canadensis]MBZ7998345.1 Rieske 2Fe-2S domain-containing protein [Campylobacter canadensis]MBZ7999636.1 Rieske 2Fe-2S domain-containing protein [Campylobacter canadensis]
MGFALGATAAVGGVFTLVGMKKTWDPLPSVKAAGFTTVDLSVLSEGELRTVEWRKKPIFILKKTEQMGQSPTDIVADGSRYTVVIGLCTHLGCIPAFHKDEQKFVCACHGGQFDINGKNISGPPPRPLEIPPFAVDGTKLVLGEEGPEYKKMIEKA